MRRQWWLFLVGTLLILNGGCSINTCYWMEGRVAPLPRMTCDELVRNGPPADGQVIVTDLRPCSRGVVYVRNAISPGDLALYVPCYPAGQAQEPEPKDLVLLLQVWDEEEAKRLVKEPGPFEVTGWANRRMRVVDDCEGPGDVEEWARTALEKKYPGIQLGKLSILSIGHGETPTAARAAIAWQYGIGEVVLGMVVLVGGLVWYSRKRLPAASAPPAEASPEPG